MARHIVLRDRDSLTEALCVPIDERNDEHLDAIIDFVKGLKIFASFSTMHPDTLKKIASKLEMHSFYANSYIFTEGDRGDHFYIVLDGEVAIVRRRTLAALAEEEFVSETVVLVKLGSGKYFGENALESADGLRTASAVATKRTRLLSLHRDDYQSVLHTFKEVLQQHALAFLRSSSSLFRRLPDSSTQALAALASIRNYSVNEQIFRAGMKSSSLMLVRTGMVKLTKSIPRSSLKQVVRRADYKIRHSSLDGTGNATGPQQTKLKKKLAAMSLRGGGSSKPSSPMAAASGAGVGAGTAGTIRLPPLSPGGPVSPKSPKGAVVSPLSGGRSHSSSAPQFRSGVGTHSRAYGNSPRSLFDGGDASTTATFTALDDDDDDDDDDDGLLAGTWLLQSEQEQDWSSSGIGSALAVNVGTGRGTGGSGADRKTQRKVSSSDELMRMAAEAVTSAASMGSYSVPVTSDVALLQKQASRSVEMERARQEADEAALVMKTHCLMSSTSGSGKLLKRNASTVKGAAVQHRMVGSLASALNSPGKAANGASSVSPGGGGGGSRRRSVVRSQLTDSSEGNSTATGGAGIVPMLTRTPLQLPSSADDDTFSVTSAHSLRSASSSSNHPKGVRSKQKTPQQPQRQPQPARARGAGGAGGNGDEVEFTVAVLLPGQVLGELTLLDPEQLSPLGAIAATSVELYCFDKRLLQRAGIEDCAEIMHALKDDWKFRNPPVEEMCQRAKLKYEWEAQKNQIMRYYFGNSKHQANS